MPTRRSTRLSLQKDNLELSDDDIENYCFNTPSRRNYKKAGMKKHVENITLESPRTPRNKRLNKISDESGDDHNSTDNIDVTPPKQIKTKNNSPLFSPSSLLSRLNIEDELEKGTDDNEKSKLKQEEKKSDEVKKQTQPINKYHSASRVLTSGETNNLPGRAKELEELEEFFDQHINNGTSGSLYVSGQPGTGKTACLSKLLKSEKFANKLTKIYINCTSISTVSSIFKKIKDELKIKVNSKMTEKESLEAIGKYLKTKHKPVLLVLDEIDQLCSSKQSVLYTIFEWPSKPEHRIILVGIANSLDLTDRMLVRLNANCKLKPKLMHFASYSKQQIIDIFKARLEEANITDIFPPATIQLLAGKVAAVSGDVRRALDIGRRVIEMAERDGKSTNLNMQDLGLNYLEQNDNTNTKQEISQIVKPVQIKQVASVLSNVYGTTQALNEEVTSNFPLQQKILLCSLLLILNKSKNKDVTVGRLHDVYKRVCNKRNILSVDQAEFFGICSLVDTRGVIRLIKKKEPRLSKVALQWDQAEVTDVLKDKQLIAAILEDDSCLGSGR